MDEIFEGGCHCGDVRFRVTLRHRRAVDCNCSICTMKGFIHLIVDAADFELLTPMDAVATYTFNTGTAKHHFCKRCGIHSFYRPRSHPDSLDVNARCLRGLSLGDFDVRPFDGKNWEGRIDELR
jgi:hypothetical protein